MDGGGRSGFLIIALPSNFNTEYGAFSGPKSMPDVYISCTTFPAYDVGAVLSRRGGFRHGRTGSPH